MISWFGQTETFGGKIKVLVVGQTPPPFGGQTLMTQALVSGTYTNAELFHVDSRFSTSLASMGSPSLKKILTLVSVLGRCLWLVLRRRPGTLYFHPAGGVKSAILRDILILSLLRPLIPTVVFHAHSRGLLQACASLPNWVQRIAIRQYAEPQIVIGPSSIVVQELAALRPGRALTVPNGTEGGTARISYKAQRPRILFMNLISEEKGASWLLDAFADLRNEGIEASLRLVGEFSSDCYRAKLLAEARRRGVEGDVQLPGPVATEQKWRELVDADIFCFPTLHPLEAFGLVLVEAASCGLPVVTSDLPGVREVLQSDVSALIASPESPQTLASCIRKLCLDSDLREALGRAAREEFEARYTLDSFRRRLDSVFKGLKEAEVD